MGGFSVDGVWLPPNFQCPLAAKLSDPKKFWRYKNVLEVLYHSAKFGGARISPIAWRSFLSVCLSVTLLNVKSLCARFRHEDVGVQKRF